jgi:hypothetical protein
MVTSAWKFAVEGKLAIKGAMSRNRGLPGTQQSARRRPRRGQGSVAEQAARLGVPVPNAELGLFGWRNGQWETLKSWPTARALRKSG